MSSSLETKFTGDSSQLEAAYQKIARENVKLREEMKKTHEEGGAAGEHASAVAEKVAEHLAEQVEHVTRMVVEYASVHKAIELASEAQEHFNELQKQSLDALVEAGGSRPERMRNMAGITKEENEWVQEQIHQLGRRYGIHGEDALNQGATAAVSATGGDVRRAIANLEMAARIVPDAAKNPDALASVAGALGDMEKITGETDPEKNAGLLLAIQSGARVQKLQNVEQNLTRAAISARTHGATPQEAWGLLEGLGQAISDPEGAETKTGVIKLTQTMDEFFDPRSVAKRVHSQLAHEAQAIQGNDEINPALRARVRSYADAHGIRGSWQMDFHDLMTALKEQHLLLGLEKSEASLVTSQAGEHDFAAQLKALRTNKELQEQYLAQKGNFGRADTVSALEGFVQSENSIMGRHYKEQLSRLPVGEAQRDYALASAAQIRSDTGVAASEAQQRLAEFEDQELMRMPEKAAAAIYKDAYAKVQNITKTGRWSGITNSINNMMVSLGNWSGISSPEDELRHMARESLFKLRYAEDINFVPQRDILDLGTAERTGRIHRRSDPEAQEKADRIEEVLRETADSIKRLVAKKDEQHEQTDRHHRENQTTARQNGARAQAAKPRGRE